MLHALILAIAAVSPSPAPSPTPSLQVIAIVRSSSACSAIVTRANAAIASALNNDASLTVTIKALHGADLDGNAIKHRNGLDALGDLAKKINLEGISGDNQVKDLRKLAAASIDPQRKKELTAFANWLGGAMWRQRKVARDLGGFVDAMDYYDMAAPDESMQDMNASLFSNPNPMPGDVGDIRPLQSVRTLNGPGIGPIFPLMQQKATDDQMAEAAARDFELRLPAIANDESMAASHVTSAMAGC
jgi:hypothetical protein